MFIQKSSSIKSNLFECNLSKITLKINGTGYANIFGYEEEKKFENNSFPDIL